MITLLLSFFQILSLSLYHLIQKTTFWAVIQVGSYKTLLPSLFYALTCQGWFFLTAMSKCEAFFFCVQQMFPLELLQYFCYFWLFQFCLFLNKPDSVFTCLPILSSWIHNISLYLQFSKRWFTLPCFECSYVIWGLEWHKVYKAQRTSTQ